MTRPKIACLTCLAVGLLAGIWLTDEIKQWQGVQPAAAQTSGVSVTAPPERQQPAPLADLTEEEERNISVYAAANRSVVNIDTTIIQRDPVFMMQREAEGSGSGAVLDREGHILTNYHVIDGGRQVAQKIDVTLASNQTYPATYVGGDKEHDIAVLKIDAPAEELFPITMGKSDNLRVGQRVYAVGNPFGWDGTMTTGIISSLNRDLPSRVEGRQMQALIQTDAAMNPGNSGGPLLDSGARMIGMCVAIAGRTGQNSGIGFAIPIDRIKAIVPELISQGHIVRADIGIVNVVETNSGLVIRQLAQNGPAVEAGLKGCRIVVQRRRQGAFVFESPGIDCSEADRIVAVDGADMQSGVQFRDKIWEHRPGDVVTLTIVREGRRMDVPVELAGD